MNRNGVVLTVNAGSSSLRLAAFAAERGLEPLAFARDDNYEEIAGQVRAFLDRHTISSVVRVVHRVVHGGALTEPCVIDATVEAEIERMTPLAPLHNPAALAGVRACRALFGPDVPQVAVFDTAFYAGLPAVARIYGLPRELVERHALRRYGFHGIAHQALWQRWRRLRPDVAEGGRVISLQLGAGCSITAVSGGRARDTSMGLTPLEGLLMATRAGDLDPGLLLYLQRHAKLGVDELEQILNEKSGLLGVSGMSADMRSLLSSNEPAARFAVDLYCYRARKYLGAYLAVLGGADAVLFGGGVGEHAPEVRVRILADMEWCGISIDAAANTAAKDGEARISTSDSRVAVWVIPVDEAAIMAQEALAVKQP